MDAYQISLEQKIAAIAATEPLTEEGAAILERLRKQLDFYQKTKDA